MADKFSVEDLLSEYNDKLDRFDANRFAEERHKELELEEQSRKQEQVRLDALIENEKNEREQNRSDDLASRIEALHAQREQEQTDESKTDVIEHLGPVIEQEEAAAVSSEPHSEQAEPAVNYHRDITMEFDSQPDQWIPQEDYGEVEPVIPDTPVESVIPDTVRETSEPQQEAQIPEISDEMPPFVEDMQETGEQDDDDFEAQARELGLDEKDIEMLRKKRNAATIKNLSKMKKQKAKRGESVSPKNRASLKDLKLSLTGKIIPKTEEFDKSQIPDSNTGYEERTEFLTKRRRRKVESFRLDSQQEEMLGQFDGEQEGEKPSRDEFESFEQAPQLLAEIRELKKTLRSRLTVLLAAGIVCMLLALANDFRFALFGIFDRTKYPAVYTVLNVLLGFVAIFESYTVLSAGIKNLIKSSADCDSLAAISMISAMISGFMALFSTSSVAGRYYHIYIGAAIIGLVFNTVGKLMIVNRTENNFRYIAGAYDRYAVKTVENEDVAANFTQG
ncbi:MAG: hypothetical protein IJ172_05125, partial [Ruminococcus sp.]|nr:hypothetical protein [Ruminococcus sp.]